MNLQSIENSVPELWTSSRHLEQLLSSGRHLYVDFIVDGRRQSNGFEATYEFLRDGVVGGLGQPSTLDVEEPVLLQQSEGHRGPAGTDAVRPSYHAGTHRSLKPNSHRPTRRDATRQFCCVVLGGVSWVLNTHTRLTALFRGYPGEPAPER